MEYSNLEARHRFEGHNDLLSERELATLNVVSITNECHTSAEPAPRRISYLKGYYIRKIVSESNRCCAYCLFSGLLSNGV